MKLSRFRLVRVISSARTDPARTAGAVDRTISERRTDSKFAASSSKITKNGDRQSDNEVSENLVHCTYLTADLDSYAARRCPSPRDGPIDLAAGAAQIISAKVGGKANQPKSVLPVEFSGNSSLPHGSHLVQERMRASRAGDGNGFDVFGRRHLCLRHLHLHLVADPGSRISPVVRRNKAARRGSGNYGLPDLIGSCAKLPGHDPVELDVHRRIVQRFFVAEIAQLSNFCEFHLQLPGKVQHIVVLRTGRCDFHHRRRPEVQDLANEISRIKREARAREFSGQSLAQFLFQVVKRNGCARLKSDVQDGFVRSARPQKHRIDWIG